MMDVDDLFEAIGEFGPYQVRQYLLLSIPIIFSSYQTIAYIFTTGNPVYRCRVPECEGMTSCRFDQPWLYEAIPNHSTNLLEQCIRYEPVYGHNTTFSECYPYSFNKENKISCDSWVFKDNENTIVTEFKILCPSNHWKLALVGTTNYLGFFIGMPVAGVFADRYGRRKVLAISCFMQSLIGVIRSFSRNYETFLILQFFGAFMSGAYNAGFVLGLEIVGPKKRVLGNAIICCFHSIGEALVGVLMWLLRDWRLLNRYLFAPGLFSIVYLWIIPESIRWLLTKGKIEETMAIFKTMAKVNKRSLPANLNNNFLQTFNANHQNNKISTISASKEDSQQNHKDLYKSKSPSTFTTIVKSTTLMLRLGNCTISWMVITMVFFGLSLTSTSVAGNKYLNFILTVLVELPGYLSTWLLMDIVKVGRRMSLALSFLCTGLTCTSFIFIKGFAWLKLFVFLLGKFSITYAYAVVYIFTAEMFPTEVRNTLLGICSMAGHIGSMLAPQTALLTEYVEPMLLWGVLSLIAAAMSLLFPETLNTKLPDTVAEAEKLGT